jgi:hypothetical protein
MMKWLTILFALFILAVILLADFGYLEKPLRIMHSFPLGDKIGHFVLIGILSFLVISSLIQALPGDAPKHVALNAGLMLAFVFTVEEVSQVPIRGRDASMADLSANYAGILVFSLLAWASNKKRR